MRLSVHIDLTEVEATEQLDHPIRHRLPIDQGAQLGRAGQPFDVPAKMLAGDLHALVSPIMAEQGLVVFQHHHELVRERRFRRPTIAAQAIHDLGRKPGPAVGAAPDHHPVGAGLGQGRLHILKAADVAVDDHRDRDRLLDPSHESPIGRAAIHLAAGPAVNRDRLNAAVLGDSGQARCVAALVVPAGPHLEGHRQGNRGRRGGQDPRRQAFVAHQRRAGLLVDHFFHRATEVDVDDRGTPVLVESRRLGHGLGVAARQLHRHRRLRLIAGRELARILNPLPGRSDHRVAGDHLRDHQPSAEALDQAPKRRIRHPRHGRQDHRRLDGDGTNLHSWVSSWCMKFGLAIIHAQKCG
jgi:hypothetical protein